MINGDGYGEAQQNRNCPRIDSTISPGIPQINMNFSAGGAAADHSVIDPDHGNTPPPRIRCG